jgi:hypothetical protein
MSIEEAQERYNQRRKNRDCAKRRSIMIAISSEVKKIRCLEIQADIVMRQNALHRKGLL